MFNYAFLLALTLITSIAVADTGQDLNDFFNQMGFASNVTDAHAYQTQAAGFAALGSVYARNQVRNIQIMHVDVPGFRSGCGGIDLFAGGASFINHDQIVKFMQSILSSGAGYALNLALETELPEIAHSMQFMQKLANEINTNNFNSCELGESAVGSLWSKNRAANQQICEDIGTHSGDFGDWARARHACSTGGEMDNQLQKAKENTEYKERVLFSTNVVWDALQANSFLASDAKLAEAYMSISGTLVFDKQGAMTAYPSLANNQDFIKSLLYGGQLPTYRCADSSKPLHCLTVSLSKESNQTISASHGLVLQVEQELHSIYDHIKSGTALSNQQKGFIEMTQPAVFSLISTNAQQGIGIQGLYVLSQSVATDLLAQYLTNSLEVIRASIAAKQLGAGFDEKVLTNLQIAQQVVDHFGAESRARFNQAMKTNELIQKNASIAVNALTPLLKSAYQGEGL